MKKIKKLSKAQTRFINSKFPFSKAKRAYSTEVHTMARKRRFGRFRSRMSRAFGRSRKPSLSVMDVLIAGALYGAVRPLIANALPTFFSFGPVDSDNVILGGAGFFASKQSSKLIKSIGLIAMGTEAGIVTARFMQGTGNGLNSGQLTYEG